MSEPADAVLSICDTVPVNTMLRAMEPALDVVTFKGPVLVTGAYFVLWYGLLLGLQRGTKYKLIAEYAARGETFDRYFGQDPRMLSVDRAVSNTLEQMGPFLVALWLHAAVVSASTATVLGAIYVGLRALYPFLLGKRLEKTQSKRVFLATGPCYAIVFYMLGHAAVRVLAG